MPKDALTAAAVFIWRGAARAITITIIIIPARRHADVADVAAARPAAAAAAAAAAVPRDTADATTPDCCTPMTRQTLSSLRLRQSDSGRLDPRRRAVFAQAERRYAALLPPSQGGHVFTCVCLSVCLSVN